MQQDTENYYLIFESWSMDPNQWSMLIDSVAMLLAIFGVMIAFFLYKKQRSDNAKDAFEFFQSSLPELKQSIEKAAVDLKEFNQSLDLDNFVNPILSAALNDKFLSKISLVHLNRFYRNNRKNKLSNFKQLLIDSNFFGNYHSYITKEINYFRSNYLKKKSTYSQWQLLRSNQFFSTIANESDSRAYKEYYLNWVANFNLDLSDFEFIDQADPARVERRQVFVYDQIKELAQDSLPFIEFSKSANEVNILANEIVSAYKEMTEMKAKIKRVLDKDISRFETVLSNMNNLLEHEYDAKFIRNKDIQSG
ncbi:hypothetical protein ESY86_06755 [Subsaximicrobium wynnwilliamsii]|uniref:Uncharacterized protein n=1 Tax=Subsaximicrobium wynnwilliamsii TaxID=291179 RepID=A0A5C6ZI72_9FLAO|nr:hypothetical protein [Subsaximicrobium wynnwilliamsii]TXD84274.1 hypothetical protein ESY87_07170 [Subsaximicrobium wynnwilliamsii]TXD89895.1 hypothetical protein ESY86_06755 [Subsaximicrobium wynnwilliamsii]TXE03986.1 hypothetical protein ESY88_07165 [Subsaximicrobium wynnwilliamsii]